MFYEYFVMTFSSLQDYKHLYSECVLWYLNSCRWAQTDSIKWTTRFFYVLVKLIYIKYHNAQSGCTPAFEGEYFFSEHTQRWSAHKICHLPNACEPTLIIGEPTDYNQI